MLEVVNRTPYEVALSAFTDNQAMNHACIAIKSTWSIGASGQVTLADVQQAIVHADVREGGAERGSLRYASDLSWPKASTDVALVGHAHAPDGHTTELDVGLVVGPVRKVVRVFGERAWYASGSSWAITPPRSFERLPLTYERAYGGRDEHAADTARHDWEWRNPAGTGFATVGSAERLDGTRLPNLECPDHLIGKWQDRPAPAGFGFVDAFWQPRCRLAGTYDEHWRKTRAPLLPDDFDPRFFNAAHPDLIAPSHLQGGEPVVIQNADPSGLLRFDLPRQRFDVLAAVRGKRVTACPVLDTVWIDADTRTLIMVWRAAVACPRSLLALDFILVNEGG
jgi:hypothetical protein